MKLINQKFSFSLLINILILTYIKLSLSLESVEKWDIFELTLNGPSNGNPFIDVTLTANFTLKEEIVSVRGFYDGNGEYRIRFMPSTVGEWRYVTDSNIEKLNGIIGKFVCVNAGENNHGLVIVNDTYHFKYSDGTKFLPFGTTVYGFAYITEVRRNQTLDNLNGSPFNKIRFCVLPIEDAVNNASLYPFIFTERKTFNFSVFNPLFFQNLDSIVLSLRDSNVEADVIIFNPYYYALNFGELSVEDDRQLVKYLVSRLSAFRNVWWSLANEFDGIMNRTDSDWNYIGNLVQNEGPYDHLISIHNKNRMFNPEAEWMSHLSVQNGDAVAEFGRAFLYRIICAKPVIYDEVCYEGNSSFRWAQLSGQDMTLRFWMAIIAGTYATHGEVLSTDTKHSWLATGGQLLGESIARIAFLKQILNDMPFNSVEPIDPFYENYFAGIPGQYYLIYFGSETPTEWLFQLYRLGLDNGTVFEVDIIDTWNMTVNCLAKQFTIKQYSDYYFRDENESSIELPGFPYIALRLERIN